jgi:hypothetical protein
MKWLCVCQYGHSRSVALARVLHGCGETAVAIGWHTSGNAIGTLGEWADRIIVLQADFARFVPHQYRQKLVAAELFDVGPDRWVNPYHTELNAILRERVQIHLGLVVSQ